MTRGLPPPDPRSVCPMSSIEFVEPPPPEQKFLCTPMAGSPLFHTHLSLEDGQSLFHYGYDLNGSNLMTCYTV